LYFVTVHNFKNKLKINLLKQYFNLFNDYIGGANYQTAKPRAGDFQQNLHCVGVFSC